MSDTKKVNEKLGLGAKGFIAQFGAFGCVVVLVLFMAQQTISMLREMQREFIATQKEFREEANAQRSADRDAVREIAMEMAKLSRANERIAKIAERMVDKVGDHDDTIAFECEVLPMPRLKK